MVEVGSRLGSAASQIERKPIDRVVRRPGGLCVLIPSYLGNDDEVVIAPRKLQPVRVSAGSEQMGVSNS